MTDLTHYISKNGQVERKRKKEQLMIEWKSLKRWKDANVHNEIIEVVDHISCLEDALFCHILSFLPTKYAVRTGVLSKRWKYLWTKTPVLDFSEWGDAENENNNKFASFVTKVLLLNNISSLKKLCFNNLLDFDLVLVNAWIANLVMRTIEEVYLDNGFYHRLFDTPAMFFTCVQPVILKLSGGSIRELPILVKFPKVKVLHLTDLESMNNNLNRLVGGCPVLEELDIYNCKWYGIEIDSSTLKRLAICYPGSSLDELLLRAPNLEELALSCIKVCSGHFDFIKRLIKGRISLHSAPLPLLRIISGAKTMCLNTTHLKDKAIKAICQKRLWFSNLINLELEVAEDAVLLLPSILKCCPILLSLIFIKGMISLTRQSTSPRPEGRWITPSVVPDCLSSTLEMIQISFFDECEDYLDMVGYLLKNAKFLKEMKLRICDMDPYDEINMLRKLIMLPRASVTCQVKIS